MTISISPNRKKIPLMLAALGAAVVLAGCAHPARTNTATGPMSDVGLTSVACANVLDLSVADKGSIRCVRLGGDVAINVFGPHGAFYPGVASTGSLLTQSVMSVPWGEVAFRASSRGTAVITSGEPTCVPSDATTTCPIGSPWSVTVIVR